MTTKLAALFEQKGFTVGGGIWGEAYWKRLSSNVIVSISTEDMDLPKRMGDRVTLYVYFPDTEDTGMLDMPFSELDVSSVHMEGPSMCYLCDMDISITDAFNKLAGLQAALKA